MTKEISNAYSVMQDMVNETVFESWEYILCSTDASECAADEETNSIVPIAVGAALAGLVIIVLIAYLIGRKRSRAGYEQV